MADNDSPVVAYITGERKVGRDRLTDYEAIRQFAAVLAVNVSNAGMREGCEWLEHQADQLIALLDDVTEAEMRDEAYYRALDADRDPQQVLTDALNLLPSDAFAHRERATGRVVADEPKPTPLPITLYQFTDR